MTAVKIYILKLVENSKGKEKEGEIQKRVQKE